jgi:regulation of enolase protein 1 (concanavalin A-like superfamily)
MSPGQLFLRGTYRSFTFQGPVSASSANWGPTRCNGDPLHCKPGDTLDLLMVIGGDDLTGTATLDGATYSVGGADSPNQMRVQFTGSVVLPALADSATLTAPFMFAGTFTHSGTVEDLAGGGTATISMTRGVGFPDSWFITHVRYTLSRLPAPWQSVEIGSVGTPGYAYQGFDGDLFMAGAGSDIWGTADSFRFVYRPIEDGEISALVGSESNGDSFAKVGVMIRQSVDPDSAHVILDVKPDGGVEFMTRPSRGAETTFLAGDSVPAQSAGGGPNVTFYATLKLVRSGGTVTASVCSRDPAHLGDPAICRTVGSAPFPSGRAMIGVAVTSHDPSVLNSTLFPADMPSVSTVPAPWFSIDNGPLNQQRTGDAFFSNGTFTVLGSGADIWGTSDSYHFVRQCFLDDGELVARVTSEQNADPFGKAGVVVTMGAPTVILDVRPTGDIEFMARQALGEDMRFVAGSAASFPVWLKLVRTGDQFTGYIADDGQAWQTVGATTVPMSHGVCVNGGLAVTSHDVTALNTSTFDHVSALSQAFADQDVGDVGIAGSVAFSAGSFTVTGSGADIWDTTDAFNFFARGIFGDGQIVARVDSLEETDPFAKAGVMIRESTDPSAAHVILDVKPDGGIEFMTRPATGAATTFIAGGSAAFPVWLKLTRAGSDISGYSSADGQSWTLVGRTTLSIQSDAMVGLIVTSHNRGGLARAMFSSVGR